MATDTSQDQRKALEDSEREAARQQPGTFEDKNLEDKVVTIPPVGPDAKPIRGLDPT
ncbi:MAG: hypothetical protein ABIO71_05785 [Caldimonas sp.]